MSGELVLNEWPFTTGLTVYVSEQREMSIMRQHDHVPGYTKPPETWNSHTMSNHDIHMSNHGNGKNKQQKHERKT